MSYRALYRTYRPKDFTEVAGQKHITITLQNALKSGKIQHAYLFSGPRGIGKTSIARIFAKAVNCEHAPVDNPCNECDACVGIQNNTINDVIEIDAASNNGVDEIREIRDKVKYLPGYVKYKVYIIDEVHMLSTGAFNALLKTLEEPPAHVIFILCTTEPHKIPLTIQSRCQRFDFKSITPNEIVGKLNEIIEQEGIKIDEDAVRQIAIYAEGGLRDAIGLLDQALAFSPEHISVDDINQICGAVSYHKQIEMVEALMELNSTKAIELMNDLIVEGKEVQKIVTNLLEFFRDMLMLKNIGVKEGASSLFTNEKFILLSKALSNQRIFFYMDLLNQAMNDIKWSNNPKLHLELCFIKMSDIEQNSEAKWLHTIEELEKRIQVLESREVVQVTKETIINVPTEVEEKDEEESILESVHHPEEEIEETNESTTLFNEEFVDLGNTQEKTEEENEETFEPEAMEETETEEEILAEVCNDLSKTYDIAFVEEVLNNGNREDRHFLSSTWHQLTKSNPSGIANQFAVILENAKLAASSIDKIIITMDSPAACNRLMKPSSKEIVKEVLRKTFQRELDYMVLPEFVFTDVSKEFITLWKKGERDIKLSPIVCEDLIDVSSETVEKEQEDTESKIVTDAFNLFGDIVKVKK